MLNLLGIVIFSAIMMATVFISLTPRLTIKIMELCNLYKKGSLINEKRNYIDGAGVHVYRPVYILLSSGQEKFVNLQIFLRLVMLTTIVCSICGSIWWFGVN